MQNDRTRKINRKLVTSSIRKLYEYMGKPCPKHIIYARSPKEVQYIATYLDQGDFKTLIKTHSYTNNYQWTSNAVKHCKQNNIDIKMYASSSWLEAFINVQKTTGLYEEINKRIQTLSNIQKYSDHIYLFNEVVIVAEKPVKVTMDEFNVPNFIKYKDGFTISGEYKL